MNPETMKQIVRHLTQEAIMGNFAPMQSHSGLQEIVPTMQHLYERTAEREVNYPLQFVDGEWLATIQRISQLMMAPIFGMETDPAGTHVTYEVVSFSCFDGDEIVKQYSQADVMALQSQVAGNPSSAAPSYAQTNHPSLSPDEACALIRDLITEAVAENYAVLEPHPALKALIPTIKERNANASAVEVSFPLQFSDGEWVATRSYWQQIAKGEMFGIDATGKELEFEVLMVHRIEDGRVVDQRGFPDIGAMMAQLGLS